jgi:hypothetical protein
LVVVFLVVNRIERIQPARQSVHLRFGVKLGHRQIAGLSRVAGPDANELPDRGQSAPQDGDREDHLQQGQAAASLGRAHGSSY